MKRSQNSRLLELLADGQPHSHHELYGLRMVGHSRVSDLRTLGYRVEHYVRDDERGEQLHWYELVAVPAASPAIERTLGERARGDLEVLRSTRPAAVAQSVERDRATVEGAGSRPASRSLKDNPPMKSIQPDGAGEPPTAHRGVGEEDNRTGPGAAEEAATVDEPAASGQLEQPALFDAPPGGAVRRGEEREYQAPASFACSPDLEVELELQAIEGELAAIAEWGADDPERVERLEARARELNDRILGRAA